MVSSGIPSSVSFSLGSLKLLFIFTNLHLDKQIIITVLRNLFQSDRSLKTIAVFEFSKGVVVLTAGFGVLSLLNAKIQAKFEDFIGQFNYIPHGKITSIIYEAITHPRNSFLLMVASFAILYSALRFAEGYGLWHEAKWAEWIGLISSLIYLPYEIYDLAVHPGILPVIFIIINLIVIYVLYINIRVKNKTRSGFSGK
jgi:uncharacterized membrane protein (DUF2068 family)